MIIVLRKTRGKAEWRIEEKATKKVIRTATTEAAAKAILKAMRAQQKPAATAAPPQRPQRTGGRGRAVRGTVVHQNNTQQELLKHEIQMLKDVLKKQQLVPPQEKKEKYRDLIRDIADRDGISIQEASDKLINEMTEQGKWEDVIEFTVFANAPVDISDTKLAGIASDLKKQVIKSQDKGVQETYARAVAKMTTEKPSDFYKDNLRPHEVIGISSAPKSDEQAIELAQFYLQNVKMYSKAQAAAITNAIEAKYREQPRMTREQRNEFFFKYVGDRSGLAVDVGKPEHLGTAMRVDAPIQPAVVDPLDVDMEHNFDAMSVSSAGTNLRQTARKIAKGDDNLDRVKQMYLDYAGAQHLPSGVYKEALFKSGNNVEAAVQSLVRDHVQNEQEVDQFSVAGDSEDRFAFENPMQFQDEFVSRSHNFLGGKKKLPRKPLAEYERQRDTRAAAAAAAAAAAPEVQEDEQMMPVKILSVVDSAARPLPRQAVSLPVAPVSSLDVAAPPSDADFQNKVLPAGMVDFPISSQAVETPFQPMRVDSEKFESLQQPLVQKKRIPRKPTLKAAVIEPSAAPASSSQDSGVAASDLSPQAGEISAVVPFVPKEQSHQLVKYSRPRGLKGEPDISRSQLDPKYDPSLSRSVALALLKQQESHDLAEMPSRKWRKTESQVDQNPSFFDPPEAPFGALKLPTEADLQMVQYKPDKPPPPVADPVAQERLARGDVRENNRRGRLEVYNQNQALRKAKKEQEDALNRERLLLAGENLPPLLPQDDDLPLGTFL